MSDDKPWIVHDEFNKVRCLVCNNWDRRFAKEDSLHLPSSVAHWQARCLMAFVITHHHDRGVDPVAIFCRLMRQRKCLDFISPTQILRDLLADKLVEFSGGGK